MLSYLTHKLRTPELNGSSAFHTKTDDDHDSGTESDDESAEIEELQKYMEHSIQLEDGTSHSPGRRRGVLYQQARIQHQRHQQQQQQQQQQHHHHQRRRRASAESSPSTTTGATAVVTLLTAAAVENGGGAPPSPVPLDSALPSDSDHNFEQHSSEEELEVINNRAGSAEKRKWSQANQRRARASLRRSRSDGAGGDTSSDEDEDPTAEHHKVGCNGDFAAEDDDDDDDDEEVRDLTWSRGALNGVSQHHHNHHAVVSGTTLGGPTQRSSCCSVVATPVEFRASPPLHVHRPYNGSPPPKVFHAAASAGAGLLTPSSVMTTTSAHIPAFEVCAVSPRKRHRQDRGGTAFGVFSLVDGGPVQRPCLDFEKMQQIRVKLL